jgi:hypothetical protein
MEMSRIGKFTESGNKLVVAKGPEVGENKE